MDKPDSQDAYIYALADVASVKLRLPDLDGAQKDLATCQRLLDSFDSVETVVHASFYKVNADYYHVRSSLLAFRLALLLRNAIKSYDVFLKTDSPS